MRPIPSALVKLPLVRKPLIGLWNVIASAGPRYSVQHRMGLWLLLDRRSNMDRTLLVKGQWEQEQVSFFTGLIRQHAPVGKRSIFLDIGSYGALYPLSLLKTGIFDELIAFEPDPVNAAQLRANLVLNEAVGAVRVIEAAVTDRTGQVTFSRAEAGRRVESRIATAEGAQLVTSIEVEAVRIDDLFRWSGAFVAIKIDIERHELQALSGMRQLLAQNTCVLQIESMPDFAPSLLSFMEAQSYRRTGQIGDDHYFIRK